MIIRLTQWTQHDFYGLAAYFGKTRRMETRFTNTIYTTETNQSSVLWPPEGEGDDEERKPIQPRFPFSLATPKSVPPYVARLEKLRMQQVAKTNSTRKDEVSVDDLLSALDGKVQKRQPRQSKGFAGCVSRSEARRAKPRYQLRHGQ